VSEGRHVDLFAILLFGYRFPAAPEDLREGWLLRTEVDGPVDRDRLRFRAGVPFRAPQAGRASESRF
jgi:hypothetical protein